MNFQEKLEALATELDLNIDLTEEPTGCQFCHLDPCVCQEGPDYNANNPKFPCYVNVYDVCQAFGGREEGGWWYTMGEPLESVKVHNKEALDKVLAEKRAEYELTEEGKYLYKNQYEHPNFDIARNRPIHSSCGRGFEYVIYVQDHFAKFFPEERPHYE